MSVATPTAPAAPAAKLDPTQVQEQPRPKKTGDQDAKAALTSLVQSALEHNDQLKKQMAFLINRPKISAHLKEMSKRSNY